MNSNDPRADQLRTLMQMFEKADLSSEEFKSLQIRAGVEDNGNDMVLMAGFLTAIQPSDLAPTANAPVV